MTMHLNLKITQSFILRGKTKMKIIDLKYELEQVEVKINNGELNFDSAISGTINPLANKIIELEIRLLKLEDTKL